MKENLANETSLRRRVVKFLEKHPDSRLHEAGLSPERLIEELHIQQIELEMQNQDLRQARENAERLQAKYRDLYDFAPVGYITLSENGKIVEANETAAKLLRVGKSQLLHRPLTDFVVNEFQDVMYFHLAKVRETEAQVSCELKLKQCGKKPFFVHLESMVIRKKENGRAEIRMSLIDIHESKLDALALRESANRNEMLLNLLPQSAVLVDRDRKVIAANQTARNRGVRVGELCQEESLSGNTFEAAYHEDTQNIECLVDENPYRQSLVTIVEDSNDAVCLMDFQGNIKAWNRMAEKMYGYSAAEALKMTVFDLIPARFKQQTALLLSDMYAGAIVKPFETKRIAKDGTVLDICLTATRIVQDGKIVAITTTERDITEHNRLFASLKELPKRIIMAQEEERSRLSQVLHSEFGQALIALKLFTVVTSAGLPEKSRLMRSVFDKIRAQLDKIISDTRTLAHRLSPPGLRYVGLIPAIQELVEAANTDKLQVRFFHNGGDRAYFKKKDIIIYRILQEALQNIQKHSEATQASISVVLKKTIFIVEVRDNGKGFDPSLLTSAKGLGLALMKQQAALIKGKLTIETQNGKGTLLKVRVPVKEKKVA